MNESPSRFFSFNKFKGSREWGRLPFAFKLLLLRLKMKNGLVINEDKDMFWYKNDLLHRDDGPAVQLKNGYEEWCQNGKLHRVDGPAIIWDSDEYWYRNGKRHRVDGPAIKCGDTKKWCIDGIQYTEEEFKYQILIMKLAGLLK